MEGTIKFRVKGRDHQIRRRNLRVYYALDSSGLTVKELAEYLGVRRETLSKRLQKDLDESTKDDLIYLISVAATWKDKETRPEPTLKTVEELQADEHNTE